MGTTIFVIMTQQLYSFASTQPAQQAHNRLPPRFTLTVTHTDPFDHITSQGSIALRAHTHTQCHAHAHAHTHTKVPKAGATAPHRSTVSTVTQHTLGCESTNPGEEALTLASHPRRPRPPRCPAKISTLRWKRWRMTTVSRATLLACR
jgi:hypothetical protein